MKQKDLDFESLLPDSGRVTADKLVALIGKSADSFGKLISICFSAPYPMCMRASRVAQLCCSSHPHLIGPYLDDIPEKISATTVGGVRRNFLKIIADFTGPEALTDPGILAELCFKWYMSPKEPPAIRIHCLQILYKLSLSEPDLRPELISVIEYCSPEDTKSIRNFTDKILKKLLQVQPRP